MDKPIIRIGTRGSDLALWQANHVKARLEALGCAVSIQIIQTQGDRIQDLSFDKLEGKGFFTKEIESAPTPWRCRLSCAFAQRLRNHTASGISYCRGI